MNVHDVESGRLVFWAHYAFIPVFIGTKIGSRLGSLYTFCRRCYNSVLLVYLATRQRI